MDDALLYYANERLSLAQSPSEVPRESLQHIRIMRGSTESIMHAIGMVIGIKTVTWGKGLPISIVLCESICSFFGQWAAASEPTFANILANTSHISVATSFGN